MNTHARISAKGILTAAALLVLGACATPLTAPEGSDLARNKLTQLQSHPQLATRAPVEIKAAEEAVIAAEVPREDLEYAQHLVLIADHKVDIAMARAQSRLYEDEREALSQESEQARLTARTREADRAREDAASSRLDAEQARREAAAAREETQAAGAATDELKRQIAELNARETDRGLVVTLGDLLFETGRSDLKGGAASNLDKLSAFLNEYADRTVLIEGHTDNVGSHEFNYDLSQRRADSVKAYLMGEGIRSNRLNTSGLGETSPVASNDSATGRQQNRRVEVVISNTTTASR
ncbi:MAG: OmpA family protein [Woeseiaceae bacterium]|nr:OmpA family protein [Woeseiaceae bacterium]